MASVSVSRLCFKCKDNTGSFNCEGCKEIFCTKHSVEHRQELSYKFEQLMTEFNVILQQTQDKEEQNELLKKDFYFQIHQWENNIIAKVHEKGEQIRQRVGEMLSNKNKMIITNIRPLMDETQRRYEKEDFFELDIERIKQDINQVQQEIDKSTQQSNIELSIKANDEIDWEDLIYIREKSTAASSSVANKEDIDDGISNGTESTINANSMQAFGAYSSPFYYQTNPSISVPPVSNPQYSIFPRAPNVFDSTEDYPVYSYGSSHQNSQYIPAIRPPNVFDITANYPVYSYESSHQTASTPNSVSKQPEKRRKQPICIIDPVGHRPVVVSTATPFVVTNHIPPQVESVADTSRPSSLTPSSATDKSQAQATFRRQFAELLSSSSNT